MGVFPWVSDTCDFSPLSSYGIGRTTWASLVAQLVKNPPAMWETQVRSLGWEVSLEKGMATLQYSCLENPMDRRAWGDSLSSQGRKESDTTERLTLSIFHCKSVYSTKVEFCVVRGCFIMPCFLAGAQSWHLGSHCSWMNRCEC